MRMARTVLALLVALIALGPLAAAASADAGDVLDDCQDGVLDENHSRSDLREAKGSLQGDVAEYTNCGEVISRALAPTGGGERRSAGTGGGTPDGGAPAGGAPADGTPLPAGDPAAYVDERGVRRDASGIPVDEKGDQVDPQTFAPETQGAIDAARRGVDVAAAGVRPDDPGTALPAPLIALLAICGLAALAAGATQLRRSGPLRRRPA